MILSSIFSLIGPKMNIDRKSTYKNQTKMAIANKFLKIRYIKLTLHILKFDAAGLQKTKKLTTPTTIASH